MPCWLGLKFLSTNCERPWGMASLGEAKATAQLEAKRLCSSFRLGHAGHKPHQPNTIRSCLKHSITHTRHTELFDTSASPNPQLQSQVAILAVPADLMELIEGLQPLDVVQLMELLLHSPQLQGKASLEGNS